MPSGSRSKEDTWNADDLGAAIRDKKDDRRRSDDRKRSDRDVRDRRKSDKDEDRDRKERKRREHGDPDHKERVRDKDRDRDKGRDRDRDRDRHDRDKGGREKDRSERRRSKQDTENGDRHREDRKTSTVDKSGSRDHVSSEDLHHRRPHDDRERRSEDKERHRKREDDGREKKHRSQQGREEEGGRSKRHRDSDVERKRSKDDQGEDRKHKSHRDRDADKRKHRSSEKGVTAHSKSKTDVSMEKSKVSKPSKAQETTKEGDVSSSLREKDTLDVTAEPEEISEESEKWRQRVAVAAESRERHSSQECVRASSSSMSGDILEDFSFSDDFEQIDATAPVMLPSGGTTENLVTGLTEVAGAVDEVPKPVSPVPLADIYPMKSPQPEELSEMKPIASGSKTNLKKLMESETVKEAPGKQSSSKDGQPDPKGCTRTSISEASAKKRSPLKAENRRSSNEFRKISTPTKGHDAKKLLTKKVYSNAGSSMQHISGRKESNKQDHDLSTILGQHHVPLHRNSPSSHHERKAKTITRPATSPRRASMSDAINKDKPLAKDKKSLKPDTKEAVQGILEESETCFRGSSTGLMLAKETPVTETANTNLQTHDTSGSKISHRASTDQLDKAAKLDVSKVSPPKINVKTRKENIAGSKEEFILNKKQEHAHNTDVDATQRNTSAKNDDVNVKVSKNTTHSAGQKTEKDKETQRLISVDVHTGKSERKKHLAAQEMSSASMSCPTSKKEKHERSQASVIPKDKEMMQVKDKENLELSQVPSKSKDKEVASEKLRENLEQNQVSSRPATCTKKEELAVKVSPRMETPTRHQRENTPVPEPTPSICKSVRRDRQGSALAWVVGARSATPFDKAYTFTASPDLKEHSSCETIPDDVSEGHNSLDLVRRLKKRKKKEELSEDSNDGYNYDDEEFEDYEDDFEDDDEDEEENDEESEKEASIKPPVSNEMDEILSALDKENERLLHSEIKRQATDQNGTMEQRASNETDHNPSNRRAFINFSSAKHSQRTSKARRRGNDLLKMIELDVAHYELFDMPPVNEYELYMRTFGCSNTSQVYVQTNDENIECETQTEEIECRDKWSQHPPEDFICTGAWLKTSQRGRDGVRLNSSAREESVKRRDEKESEESERKPIDVVKLTKFVHKAGQVITMLLEEEFSEISTQHGPIKNQSNIVLSESFVQLEESEITKDRHVAFTYFSPLQTKFLLTVYSKPHTIQQKEKLSSSGLICVWNVGEPSQPEKVLACESEPRCCCFSPGKATLVFAGMRDGSLVVWDLSEPSSLHRTHAVAEHQWLLRYPTYDTAGVLHHENHHSSVVQVTPIVATGDSAQASLNGDMGMGGGEGMSFQLASLEEQAVIHLWVVAEIMYPDPAGSESDLGLLPGGKVKLVKSSTIQLENPTRTPTLHSSVQALDLCLLPQNNSHFYVATDSGSIIHGVRYGGKAPPKAYRPQTEGLVKVTSLDFSPFCEPTFLAGCADGSLRLYTTESEYPLITWSEATEKSTPIMWVRWCRSRPSVFFVLDSNAYLYIWDLLMDDLTPLKQEKVADAKVTSFALSNDYSATGCGTPGRKPQMVMCLENGAAEVHSISREFSAMMPDELNQFSQYLEKVV